MAEIGAEMIFSILMSSSVHSNLLFVIHFSRNLNFVFCSKNRIQLAKVVLFYLNEIIAETNFHIVSVFMKVVVLRVDNSGGKN